MKAVVAGAAGGIGQPLSLLLKLSPYITQLTCYDVVNVPGVGADLSHISTPVKVDSYLPIDNGLDKAMAGADIVIIPAGIPRKPGMTRDDLFRINAGIVRDLITAVAEQSPKAFILVISNPVNSTVPVAAEVLKAKGVFDPKRLFGVTTLDTVRAETFVSEILGQSNPKELGHINVVGGHSGETIVPLFSHLKHKVPEDKLADLVKRVQFGGDEVVKAKDGMGSATLSMAWAGYRFAEAVLKAAKGEQANLENAYIHLQGVKGGEEIAKATGCDYFAVPVELGREGVVAARDPFAGGLTDGEKVLLGKCYEGLKDNISKGATFITSPSKM